MDRESLGPPSVYGDDRVFAYLRLEEAPDAAQDAAVAALEKAGKPVVAIRVATSYDMGEEFVRWEIATAVAGAILGINPFNQPDVEASKIATRSLTGEYEKTGSLPRRVAVLRGRGREALRRRKNAEALRKAAGPAPSVAAYVKAHLDRARQGRLLRAPGLRRDERGPRGGPAAHAAPGAGPEDTWRPAWASGPEFLHSTGQAYKGGPNSGVFLQVTCDDAEDLAVPGLAIQLRRSSRRPRPGATSRSWPTATGAPCASTSGADVAAGLRTLGSASFREGAGVALGAIERSKPCSSG